MSKIDKLSEWLLNAVQGGAKGQIVSKPFVARPEKLKSQPQRVEPNRNVPRPPPANVDAVAKTGRPVFHPKTLRVIPIGGLEEVGKNSMIAEYENDIIAIDMGFQFPDDELFGVDYIIPDIQYLVERKNHIRGIVITHAHLDHIGALAYVLPDLGFPVVYGSKLTIGLIQKQLEEFKMLKQARLKVIDNEQIYQLGAFTVDFFHVNHSIPDAMGVRVKTPVGSFVHTGDFKFDFTPADGVEADIKKMTAIGNSGVDVMFSDSTNALKPGHTISERMIAENLESAISESEGRIIIACFSSLIGRIQQIVDFAESHGRKVFLSGGSLEANVEIAHKLGFLNFHKDQLKSIREVNKFSDREVLILTTGGQGEPMAALSRMAGGAHAQVKIHPGDTVLVSSSPIIGNEKQVAFLVDSLMRLGANVVHNQIMDVHTSGHGHQEDLKMMMSLIRPKHLVPVHGSFSMRTAHAGLAPSVGIAKENVHLMDNGMVLEIKNGEIKVKKEDIKVRYVVVDGGVKGDLGSQVLKDREIMAQNGFVNVVLKMRGNKVSGDPIVTARGFVYQKELSKILREIEKRATMSAEGLFEREKRRLKEKDVEDRVRSDVAGFIVHKLNRRPLINIVVIFV